jgi:hypothetical protein
MHEMFLDRNSDAVMKFIDGLAAERYQQQAGPRSASAIARSFKK